MNTQCSLTVSGAQPLRIPPNLPSPDGRKTRIAVFGSFMGGYHVLQELLLGPLARRAVVVGVATDDPTQAAKDRKKILKQEARDLLKDG